MRITRIYAENYKSFSKLELTLGSYTVVVGANAAGKSNVVSLFQFVRDLRESGLDDAIALQGGSEYLRNSRISHSRPFILEVDTEVNVGVQRFRQFTSFKQTYRLQIQFNKRGSGYKVIEDKLFLHGVFESSKQDDIVDQVPLLLITNHVGNKIQFEAEVVFGQEQLRIKSQVEDFMAKLNSESFMPPLRSGFVLLQQYVLTILTSYVLEAMFEEIYTFDFDTKKPKRAVAVVGKAQLASDGGNLPVVLRSAFDRPEFKSEFKSMLKAVIPFIDDVRVVPFPDKSLGLNVHEVFNGSSYLPGFTISDGTMGVLCLLTALYLNPSGFIAIEEPERNIHPTLISKVARLFGDSSEKRQVLVTTHNPILLKNSKIEDVRLVKRNKDGFSEIAEPANMKDVADFLSNELGLDDLMISGVLK